MSRITRKPPSYRHHKVTGYAVVTIAGCDHYLGAHGTPEIFDAYKRLISEWSAAGTAAVAATAATKSGADFRICALLAAYYEHADRYYVKDGEPTGETKNIKDATRLLQALSHQQRLHDLTPRIRGDQNEAQIGVEDVQHVAHASIRLNHATT